MKNYYKRIESCYIVVEEEHRAIIVARVRGSCS